MRFDGTLDPSHTDHPGEHIYRMAGFNKGIVSVIPDAIALLLIERTHKPKPSLPDISSFDAHPGFGL